MRKILNNYNKLIKLKNELKDLYKEQFDNSDDIHKAMLFDLWDKIKKNKDIQLVDKKWRNYN